MSVTKLAREPTTAPSEDWIDMALLLRGIPDELWIAVLRQGAEHLMLRFPPEGGTGFNAEMIREALLADMDPQLLTEAIGRELVSRLMRTIERGSGLALDLGFHCIEVLPTRSVRVLRMTASRSAAASIYDWLIRRPDVDHLAAEKAVEMFGPWEWGGNLDSIVRLIVPSERRGISGYSNILREMSNDMFVAKAMVMALRRLDRYYKGIAPGEGLRH